LSTNQISRILLVNFSELLPKKAGDFSLFYFTPTRPPTPSRGRSIASLPWREGLREGDKMVNTLTFL
jgi:hypothetical protein